MNKTKKVENGQELILQRLEEYRQETRLAIEVATNAPYVLVGTRQVCQEMGISPRMLTLFRERFDVPAHKIGRKNYYFMAEIKNAIINRLRTCNP